MTPIRRMTACLALLGGLLAGTGPAMAATCQAAIDGELQRLSIPSESVDSITVARRSFGARSSSNYLYDAWVKLNACDRGHFVVTMTKYCMVMDSYTRGGCSLPAATEN